MPQNASAATVAVQSGVQKPLNLDASGTLVTGKGTSNRLNITSGTVVKATAGRVVNVIVNTAGSAPGTVSDIAATGSVAAANLVFNIPNTVGVYTLDFPCATGITVVPGTGQVVSVSYN